MNELDGRLSALSDGKRALLTKLLRERSAAIRPEIAAGGREPAPLSAAQRQFWLLSQQAPGLGVYNVPMVLRLRGALDNNAVEIALRAIVRRHHVLRTHYRAGEDDPEPDVDVVPDTVFVLGRSDVSASSEPEAAARAVARAAAEAPFDLETDLPLRAVLVRAGEHDHVLAVVVHHIAADGASVEVLFEEFVAAYQFAGTDAEDVLPPLTIQYSDFARWQASPAVTARLAAGLDFWAAHLDGAPNVLELPTDRPRPPQSSHRGGRRRTRFSTGLTEAVRRLSAAEGVTPFMTLLAGLGVVLRRYTGGADFLIGTPVANRPTEATESLIGCFANTLVLRVHVDGSATVQEVLARLCTDTTASYDHQDVPFEQVVGRVAPQRSHDRNPLFQVMFVHQRPADRPVLPGLEVELFDLHNGTAKFDLDLSLLEDTDGIDVACEYNADVFAAARIDRMLSHLRQALTAMMAAPGARIAELDVLTPTEIARAARDWNGTSVSTPVVTIPHQVAERVRETPSAPAVRAGDEVITYAELAGRARQLARVLAARGVRPGSVVGVAVERSAELPVALLGVLEAGGAYLPLDLAHPVERLELLLTDSGARVVLSTATVRDRLPADTPVLLIDKISDEPQAEPIAARPEHLCYLIYTSGSTGRPKGVLLDHRGRVNNFGDFNRRFSVRGGDAVLSVSSLGFDMTAYDVLGTLIAGGTLVLPEPERDRDPGHWLELIRRDRVTIWHSVPALLGLLLDAAEDLGVMELPGLRLALLGGDWIPLGLADRLRRLAPDARVIALGGATEASMDSTIHEITAVDPAWRSIPYGRPMTNQTAYIVDSDLHLVPPGVPGELCLGGVGLAWGYAEAPARTADKFVPNPFSGVPGARMYRTGDLAQYFADGELELIGRLDFQVKIAGNRIELGEVEAALRGMPSVAACVAAAPHVHGRRVLVGYVVPKPEMELDLAMLRESLRTRLPDAAVPSLLVELDRIPLTFNGKINRNGLPAPEQVAVPTGDRLPRDGTETVLARIWGELLGLSEVSATDGFFTLGGDSVACIRMIARARAAGVELSPKLVFRHQTIEALAAEVDRIAAVPAELAAPFDTARCGVAPIQRHMLNIARRRPVPGLYVIRSAVPLPASLDGDVLDEAWRHLFRRHAALRTFYPDPDAEHPVQVVADDVEPHLELTDLRGLAPAEQEHRVIAEQRRIRLAGFDLTRAPLLSVHRYLLDAQVQLMVQHHHYSLLDGWSCMQLRRELLATYLAIESGTELDLPEPMPFTAHVAWLDAHDRVFAVAYWARYLDGTPGPWAPEPGAARDTEPVRLNHALPVGLLTGADAFGRAHGITFATLVQLAWAHVLGKRGGGSDVVFGVTSSGRPALLGAESAVGPFINTVPVRYRAKPGEDVVTAAQRLQAERIDADEHGVIELSAMTGGRSLGSVLVFDNYPVDDALRAATPDAPPDHPLLRRDLSLAQTEFPIRIDVLRGPEGSLTFTFAVDQPLPTDAARLGVLLDDALSRIVDGPHFPRAAGTSTETNVRETTP